MQILLTNYDLSKLAGSETWTMTMFNELSKSHDVDVYVPEPGVNTLIKAGYDRSKQYDLAIINHNTCLKDVEGWNIKKRIFTSHGIVPALEQPIPGADVYVSVSEEVQDNLTKNGYKSVIIRNPIDTDYFSYSKPNKELKNILFLNNKQSYLAQIEKICEDYSFIIHSLHRDNVRDSIHWADLVISSGRGCYEALSCGKNVYIINRFGVDGMVTWENIYELRKNNCSGRRFDYNWTMGRVQEELGKYDPDRNMRPYILENNNVKTIAGEYLSL